MKSSIQESIICKSNNKSINNILNNKHDDQSRYFAGLKIIEPNLVKKNYQETNIGPNVNLKISKKIDHSSEQKEYFKKKISKVRKTEMCKNWELYGDCYFKETCSFAHGEIELRNKVFSFNNNNQKYKTKPCKSFIDKSYCPFGNRCQYTHVVSQNRLLKYTALNYKLANGIILEALKIENEKIEFDKLIENVNISANFKM